MSFHTTIARLREASFAAPVTGENPNTCRVGRQDLRTALHVIDRLDADLRQAGTLAHGAVDAPVANSIQWPTMPACKGQSPVLFEDGYAEGWAKCMDECRRAVSQASAPVAGEAVSIPDEAYAALQYVERSLAAIANRQEVVGDVVERIDTIAAAAKRAKAALSRLQSVAQYFDTAPQASEAVRDARAEGFQAGLDKALQVLEHDDFATRMQSAQVIRFLKYQSAALPAPQASEAVRGQDAGDVVAVLVYRSKGRPGAHGQTLGANGAGEFAVVYRGDEFAALVKANEEIRALEAAGHRLDFAAIIHGEGYSGPMLRQEYVTRAALSAQPAAEPLSNPKQFALTAADERTAFEATYLADYDDPGAACEREHFGKGYRAGTAAQPGAQSNDPWQPIETAPKDQVILLFAGLKKDGKVYAPHVNVGYWTEQFGWTCLVYSHQEFAHIEPTHWMPRPAFPKQHNDGGAE